MSVCGTVTIHHLLEAFLGSRGSAPSTYYFRWPVPPQLKMNPDFPQLIRLHGSRRTFLSPGHTLLRHSIDKHDNSWYGILTCFPSPTSLDLGLGPTNPGRINLAQETSGLRRTGFSPVLSLLVPTFSLLLRPALLTVCLQPTAERSPTTNNNQNYY